MMLTFGQRLQQLGAEFGDRPAIVTVAYDGARESLSWSDLDRYSGALAERMLAVRSPSPIVAVPGRYSIESICHLIAVVRTGLVVFPFDPNIPLHARARMFSAVRDGVAPPVLVEELLSAAPDRPAGPGGGGILLLTGGTSGPSRPVLRPGAPGFDPVKGAPLLLQETGWRTGQTHLVVGPLCHAAPLNHLLEGLLSGNTMVLPEVFEPGAVLELIGRLGINWMQLTPTHMRLLDPLLRRPTTALRNLTGVLHTAAPCPPDTKRVWLDAVGPDKLFEMYAATEDIGQTLCRGTEWLKRPGTVGRGFLTRIRIYDDDGQRLPAGEVGTVYMRAVPRAGLAGRMPVIAAHRSRDGFQTVGDHGALDDEGFLFLAGRADDLAIVGGENVYTSHVTSVVLAHPGVADATVVAEPDEIYGSKLVALVVPRSAETPPTEADVLLHCLDQLAAHQVPAEVRLVADLGRSASGKLPHSPYLDRREE
jgi:bile acid-coenzyme A ligase